MKKVVNQKDLKFCTEMQGGNTARFKDTVAKAIEKGDFEPVYAYVRVSTDGQAEEDKFGIAAQKSAINRYCKEHRLIVKRWFTDVCSGTTDLHLRKGMTELILYSKTEECKKVLCYKNDRVARDMQLYFYTEYLLSKSGVNLISINEDFGVDGQYASVIKSMMLFVAEQERRNILMRTDAGRKVKREKGGYVGGMIPYGYENGNNKNLKVNMKEAWVVKYVFYRRELGASTPKIAEELNRRKFMRRNGKEWNANSIRSILLNAEFYAGFVRVNDNLITGKQSAIVTKEFLEKMLDWNEHKDGKVNPLTLLYNNILYRETHPEKFEGKNEEELLAELDETQFYEFAEEQGDENE